MLWFSSNLPKEGKNIFIDIHKCFKGGEVFSESAVKILHEIVKWNRVNVLLNVNCYGNPK